MKFAVSMVYFTSRDPDELVIFGLTWVENFYYIDPVECSRDLKCVETIFEMHSTVLKLTLENKYAVNTSREMLESTVKKLLTLREITNLESQLAVARISLENSTHSHY